MSLRLKKTQIFAALELTYGLAVVLTGADAILTKGAKISPLEGSTVNRELDGGTFGNDGALHVGTHVKLEFDVELAGSGDPGTAPKWGRLMKACQMAEDVVADTSVAYVPASDSTDSLTMYFQMDGQRHALKGARGSWSLKMDSQGIPYIHFTFTGLYIIPVTVADLVRDVSAFIAPRPVTFANTPSFNLHGIAASYKAFSYDHKNTVEYFDNPGEELVEIVDRKPDGSISLKAPAISTKDYFSTARADTVGTLSMTHGMTAGNICTFSADRVQLLQPKYGDDKGRAMIDANLSFVRDVGDDEIELLLT
jgi:hypothetical protein